MKLGSTTVNSVKLGSTQVQKVYLGSTEIWTNAAPPPAFTGLVDLLKTASNADSSGAYSLNKTKSSYTGSCIEVRRSSDNTTTNIGFVNGVIDTASLLAFTGTGALDNGFVKTWYDQSGNSINYSQTTLGSQPKIVSAGTVITQNLKPAVSFDGIDDFLSVSNAVVQNSSFTSIAIFNPVVITTAANYVNNDAVWSDGINTTLGLRTNNVIQLDGYDQDDSSFQVTRSITPNTQILSFCGYNSNNVYLSVNGGTIASSGTVLDLNFASTINIAKSAVYSEIKVQELIFYKSYLGSYLSTISNYKTSFYG
jgi:hypothetical protein